MLTPASRAGLGLAAAALLVACGGDTIATSDGAHRMSAARAQNAATVVTFTGPAASYTIAATGGGFLITDTRGIDAARTVGVTTRVRFADSSISFDVDGKAGQLYRLYKAALGRTPDAAGIGYWLGVLESGVPLSTVATGFLSSTEFKTLFGADPANNALVDAFYRNVLGRAGEQAGIAYWLKVLNDNLGTRSDVLVGFTDSPENRELVDPTIANGFMLFETGASYSGIGAVASVKAVDATVPSSTLGATVNLSGVVVKDAAGQPLANVKVDFAVAADHGTLAAAAVLTDASGVAAAPAWTLGPLPGTQTVTASVAGGMRTELRVNTSVPAGCATAPAAVGYNYMGAWSADDCVDAANANRHYDQYRLALAGQTNFKMNLAGHSGRKFALLGEDGRTIGTMPSDAFAPAAASSVEFRFALPAGNYSLRAYATDSTTLGDYTMKLGPDFITTIADKSTCAPIVFTTFGAVIEQSLNAATSCSFLDDIEDRYILLLQQGDAVEISVDSSAYGPFVALRDDRSPTGPTLVSAKSAAPGTVTVAHTATFSGFHEIIVSSSNFVTSGAYTLRIVKK